MGTTESLAGSPREVGAIFSRRPVLSVPEHGERRGAVLASLAMAQRRSSGLSAAAARAALAELESLRFEFGESPAQRKCELLARMDAVGLPDARSVRRLHEVLLVLRAYPDAPDVLARAEKLLVSFGQRRDLRRFRAELADSGIAGTDTRYPFFAPTARRLIDRFGSRLRVDWATLGDPERLEGRLALLASYSETPGLDEWDMPLRKWVARLKGPKESDAEFLVRRLARLGPDAMARDTLYEELGLELILPAGEDTPSRTRELAPLAGPVFRTRPLDRGRPDIRAALRAKPRSVRACEPAEAAQLVELARDAMVTRQRDLDAFMHADARDVRRYAFDDGLEFIAIGVVPERRLMLESVYAFLTLHNGVPMGYVLASALFGSSELAYNVFDTFRGGEAGAIYGHVLTMARALFGSRDFTVYPYQLGGDGNSEGLKSGAWWFYQKLGFRPRDSGALALMEDELRRMQRRPGERSSIATLRKLARHNVYWHFGRARDDVIGVFPLENVGLAITDMLAHRFGSERERGVETCAREAAALCGDVAWRAWSREEQLWWRRWAPLVVALPGISQWSASELAGLVACVRAKGGTRESDFVRLLDGHRKLRAALRHLARDGWRSPSGPSRGGRVSKA